MRLRWGSVLLAAKWLTNASEIVGHLLRKSGRSMWHRKSSTLWHLMNWMNGHDMGASHRPELSTNWLLMREHRVVMHTPETRSHHRNTGLKSHSNRHTSKGTWLWHAWRILQCCMYWR